MAMKDLMLFGLAHTRKLCPSCEKMIGVLRRETLMPVPTNGFAPLSVFKGMGYICFDCGAAETVMRLHKLDWDQARIAVANDRQEKLRLPGVGCIGLPYVKAAREGDLDRLQAWHDEVLPEDEIEDDL